MCTVNQTRGRPFGPDGCQVPCGSGVCGETRTLEIINEFKRLYEERMNEIDTCGGGDCLQEKFKLQQEWIGDLTEQNQMLVSAVEELEHEATERVRILEEKLQQSAQRICEVMKRYREYDVTNDLLAEPLQKVFCLENDKKNLLEFIRRIREENRWDIDGLNFFEISYQDLLGSDKSEQDFCDIESKNEYINTTITKEQTKLKERECKIKELKGKLEQYSSFGNIQDIVDDLKTKKEECERLKESMEETKHALVAEIASKHDIIVQLKMDCQQLEERCIQADKHTAFRDDIIKELRKEIKQLKQQGSRELSQENELLREKIKSLESETELLNINYNKSNGHMQENLPQCFENGQSIYETHGFIQEFSILENLDANNNIVSAMRDEIIVLNKCIEVKDAQLREQLELIKVLVSKLFNTDQGLKFLEERAASIVRYIFNCRLHNARQKSDSCEQQVESLKFKIETLEKQNSCLECTIKEDKCQIENLEKQFNVFLSDKDELKQKGRHKDAKCRQLLDENGKLAKENEALKVDIEKIKKCNIRFKNELKHVEEELENMRSKTGNCNCIVDQVQNEKQTLMNEMFALNQENRNLLKTVDCLKKRIDYTSQLTHNEIIQLNTTIDELQSNLQRTKELQEQEEQRYRDIIAKLGRTIQGLALEMKEIEEKNEKSAKVCKICKGRSKVQFAENAEVQACLDGEELECQMEVSKDEIIKVQNNTLNMLQMEIASLKKQDSDLRMDQENKHHEIQALKNRIAELETVLQDCDLKEENLQLAVDLYLNSINVLEASEEKYKIEIDQQKSTISNLQSALVSAKQELDEIRQKSEENEQEQHGLINTLSVIMSEAEHEKQNLSIQYECISDEYGYLQNLNFDLEVEHCNSLQDVDLLENQLFKYQTLLKSTEEENMECKNNLKKLLKQKKCYEEVIAYFKQEMCSMSEQLIHLQELMTLSNESTQEETCKLMQALVNIQALNEQLSTQLIAAEQKVALENQMNVLQEAKIGELQELISDRELDLTRHDNAIRNIRQSLECSLNQNEELRSTIFALNDTIAHLHAAVNLYEMENSKCKETTEMCRLQITACMEKLEELKYTLNQKTEDLQKLEMAYNSQNRYLQSAQMELKEIKDKQKDKQGQVKSTIEELKTKLRQTEEAYSNLRNDFSKVQSQLGTVEELKTKLRQTEEAYTNLCKDFSKVQSQLDTHEELKRKLMQTEEAYSNLLNDLSKVKSQLGTNEELKTKLMQTEEAYSNLRKDFSKVQSQLGTNEELKRKLMQTEEAYSNLRNNLSKVQSQLGTNEELKTKLMQTEEAYSNLCKDFSKVQSQLGTNEELKTKLMQTEEAYSNLRNNLSKVQTQLGTNEELKTKLMQTEEAYSNLCNDFSKVQSQLASLVTKEAVKDTEVKRYRKIVCDLKETLIELNKSLTNRDVQKAICINEECSRKNMELCEALNQEACLNCPCEVEFYQNIVETLKRSVIDLKTKLTDTQKKNQQLEEDSRRKEAMLEELSKSHSQKDKEYNDLRQKLKEKLGKTQTEDTHYQELAKQFQCELDHIREELEVKTIQLNDVRKGALEINSSRCVQLACAQEEVNALKDDLNKILKKHRALNAENEKLHCQSASMQETVNDLEEKSQLLNGQLEQYLAELQIVQNEKDVLAQKNSELLSELRSVQYAWNESNRQNRAIQSQYGFKPPKKTRFATPSVEQDTSPPTCDSPWSLGSQGTASCHDTGSQSRSPSPQQQQCDWYCTNFRNDSEDEEDEDWVSKVEHLAAEVRKTNKMWKNKMGSSDYTVSRDTMKK